MGNATSNPGDALPTCARARTHGLRLLGGGRGGQAAARAGASVTATGVPNESLQVMRWATQIRPPREMNAFAKTFRVHLATGFPPSQHCARSPLSVMERGFLTSAGARAGACARASRATSERWVLEDRSGRGGCDQAMEILRS